MSATHALPLAEECRRLDALDWPRPELERLLESLPSEDEYHPDATCRYVVRFHPRSLPGLRDLLDDPDVSLEVRYHALIGIATHLANTHRHDELRDLLGKFRPVFAERPRLELLRNRPDSVYATVDAYMSAIDGVNDIVLSSLKNDPSALCHYCELVLNGVEDFPELAHQPDLLNSTRRAINRAIRIDDYPKYHAVLARVLSIERDWSGARAQYREAIATEDRSRADYDARILEYRQGLLLTQARQSALEVGDRVVRKAEAEIRAQVDAVRRDHLTAMALFAALVTFAITGAQAALADRSFRDTVQLLVVLGGAWIIVSAAFSLLFGGGRLLWLRAMIAAAAGTGMVVLAVTVLPTLLD